MEGKAADPVREVTSSVVTLVSDPPPTKDEPKRSKKLYYITAGALICTVAFVIATGFLADRVGRSGRQLDSLRNELKAVMVQETVKEYVVEVKQKEDVCHTKECVTSAAALLEAIDPTADPCDDFFRFACGGWIKKNAIPDGRLGISSFSSLSQDIYYFTRDFFRENNTINDLKAINSTRIMYKACDNVDAIESIGITPLVHLLNAHGRWPMTVTNWTEERFDWRKTIAYMRNTIGSSYLIEVTNYIDVNNTEKSVIYIDQPDMGIPLQLFKNANLTSPAMIAYATFVSSAAVAVRDVIGGGAPNAAIIYDVQEMILFQLELAKIFTPMEQRTWEIEKFYNPYTISALQEWTDNVNLTKPQRRLVWREFLDDVYSVANVSMENDERVIVIEPQYLRKLVELLDKTSPRVIANYIHWRMVYESIPDLTIQMNVMAAEFWKALYGPSRKTSRWYWCMKRVEGLMGFAVGSRYIEKAFDHHAKADMEEMIRNLKIAFSSLVEEAHWMDQETKIKALEKARSINDFIGYPDWIANKTSLDQAYRGVEARLDRHFENFRTARQFMVQTNLKFLRFRTDRKNLWISFPAVVNAFYYPLMNSITFPAGILQPPFYGKGRLAALNYGSIGVVIGHEITHGFDNNGRKSDKDGHERLWWTNQTLEEFHKRKQCFIEQYGNYTIKELEGTEFHHVNGTLTQGENIADNGGLREAFRAYQNYVALNGREPRLPGLEQYSPEQIFFLSYANVWCGHQTIEGMKDQIAHDPHSPGRFRTLGALSNSADFVSHFKCPSGAMNRPQKCILCQAVQTAHSYSASEFQINAASSVRNDMEFIQRLSRLHKRGPSASSLRIVKPFSLLSVLPYCSQREEDQDQR